MNRNPSHKFARRPRVDLGLAIMEATLHPGQRLQTREIAAFCGVSHQAISSIEKKALLKLRQAAIARGISLEEELGILSLL